jgi:Protein of unknown function (DUF4232)
MKVERIEEQLRSQPPDEPTYRGDLLLAPTLVRATAGRTRGRSAAPAALVAAVLLIVALVVVPLVAGPLGRIEKSPPPTPPRTPEPSTPLGVIPWSDATPLPSPTPDPTPDPRGFRACTADDVEVVATGWGGATGSLAGGVEVIGLNGDPCTVAGKPAVTLLDARGKVIAAGTRAAPSPGSDLVVVPVGAVADVTTVWSNWCGSPPDRPLKVRVRLPGDNHDVVAVVHEIGPGSAGETPRCDSPSDSSSIGVALEFSAVEASAGGYEPEACSAGQITAYLGRWGAAAGTWYANLVLLNLSGVDCRLEANPGFELRDRTGKLLLVATAPPAPSVFVPAGWAATVRVGFADWCTPVPAMPLAADVVVASRRVAVEAAELPVPPCMGGPAPNLLYDGSLAVPGTPTAPEPDPIDSLPVSVTLSTLPNVMPGGTLDYTVTLTNISEFDKPLNLLSCPPYTQRLFLPGRGAARDTTLRLNCDSVIVFPPHVPMVFAMRLPIPSDAPIGVATILWQLGARGAAAKATFVIAR